MFIVGVAAYITPKAALAFTQGGSKELRRVLRTASLVYGCIVGAFVVCVLATGDLLLVRVFGRKICRLWRSGRDHVHQHAVAEHGPHGRQRAVGHRPAEG